METKQNKPDVKIVSNKKINIKEDVEQILKTLILFEKSYGQSYLLRFLKGWTDSGLKSESHRDLETFGSLANRHAKEIRKILARMLDEGMIEAFSSYLMIRCTDIGKAFLENPEDMLVFKNQLRFTEFENMLDYRLGEFCKKFEERTGQPGYKLYTRFTRDRIIALMPRNVEELMKVQGIGVEKTHKYGEMIINAVREIIDLKERKRLERVIRIANGPTSQLTKVMLNEGKALTQIASERGLKEATILSHIRVLHEAGLFEASPWIEQNIDSKVLFKGAEYFRKHKEARMNEAFNDLGIDYNTLSLCRLYVSEMTTSLDRVAV